MARLNYVELPVRSTETSKAFFADAFGWSFTDFGPTYAATQTGDTDLGLQGDRAEWTSAPLAVIQVDDLEASIMRREAEQIGLGDDGFRAFHGSDPRSILSTTIPRPGVDSR